MRLTWLFIFEDNMFKMLLSFHVDHKTYCTLLLLVTRAFSLGMDLRFTLGWSINYRLVPQTLINSARSQRAKKHKQITMSWLYNSTFETIPTQAKGCFSQ